MSASWESASVGLGAPTRPTSQASRPNQAQMGESGAFAALIQPSETANIDQNARASDDLLAIVKGRDGFIESVESTTQDEGQIINLTDLADAQDILFEESNEGALKFADAFGNTGVFGHGMSALALQFSIEGGLVYGNHMAAPGNSGLQNERTRGDHQVDLTSFLQGETGPRVLLTPLNKMRDHSAALTSKSIAGKTSAMHQSRSFPLPDDAQAATELNAESEGEAGEEVVRHRSLSQLAHQVLRGSTRSNAVHVALIAMDQGLRVLAQLESSSSQEIDRLKAEISELLSKHGLSTHPKMIEVRALSGQRESTG